MDTEQFLARVIPPGNYIAIAYNPHPEQPGSGFAHQFFPGGDYASAAGMLKWAASKNMDAYHACAAFTMADPAGIDKRGKTKFKGSRTQENAQKLRVFWIDLDVKRDGDKKKSENVYPDQLAAFTWLASFWKAVGLPRPNLVVGSGYGVHAYWVLEEPLTAAEWLPYGSALKVAMVANGYKGDSGLSADSARILRPPGTVNMKSGTPVPVTVFSKWSLGDYPNAIVLDPLRPYVGHAAAAPSGSPTRSATVTTLSAGGASPAFSNLATAPNLAAAAQANLPAHTRTHEFARIATKCAQVQRSLANHGNGDDRPLWYLGHLSLAHFCVDGAQFVHVIGDGDPRYTPTGTDAEVARIAAEQAKKDTGPPTCSHYATRGHPGLCQACPFFGKIRSPWSLGADDSDLPDGYRRHNGTMQRWVPSKEEGGYWTRMLNGVVSTPVLDVRPAGGYSLMFQYEFAGKSHSIRVDDAEMPIEAGALRKYFSPQHLSLTRLLAQSFGDFMVAWLEKLRENRLEREERLAPFGWARDKSGTHSGFAVGGTLYRTDGSQEAVPGGDRQVIAAFRPTGTLAGWQQACDLVALNRPDLQILIATAFAAPLVRLTGHKGVVLSAWSRDSGVGKSAALRVGQAVFASPAMMSSMEDTANFMRAKIAATRVIVCVWDEARVSKDDVEKKVNMFFELTQGKDKGRLNADSTMKYVGEWETMLVVAGNTPMMDHIVRHTSATDAGAVRLFELHLTHPTLPHDPRAAKTIGLVDENYGEAGVIYAKYLAENMLTADDLVSRFSTVLDAALDTVQAERFHLATMATIMAGAKISNKLGLTRFDLRGMMDLLKDTFIKLREERKRNLVVNSGVIDLEQVLSSFVSDHIGRRLITDRFVPRGPHGKATVLWDPQQRDRLDIHIGHHDQIMRINHATFSTWCYRQGYPASEMLEGFTKRWGAMQSRRVIGAGTGYAGGQLTVIDIPLVSPELSTYLYDAGGPAPASTQASSPALAGNQPRV